MIQILFLQKGLRGGGCGQSKQKGKNTTDNVLPESEIPHDFLTNLNDNIEKIIDKASKILDQGQKVEVLMAIQWFFYNREHLNTCCISNKLTTSICNLVQNNFENLLKILPVYLRANWYLCYQVLQICNELARILYSFQLKSDNRHLKVEKQQEYLNDLEEFTTQLEIEKANVWKCGIEYELNLIKIMLINTNTNSQEGQELLIDIVKNIGQSIVSLSATDDLIPSLMNGAKFLLLKCKDKILYPLEIYATYYLFQTIKWSIIKQLKSKYSVYKQIKQLKDTFQEHIQSSDNWILHSCWIMMIIDILAYRPFIQKELINATPNESQYQRWNKLIEARLIQCVSYNPNEAQIVLFAKQQRNFDQELVNLLGAQGKIKFELFQQCLLNGELAHKFNIWDFYKNFSFQKNQQIQYKDYEILLANNELNTLEKSFEYLKQSKDEIFVYQLQIQELLTDEFLQLQQTELSKKLYQDELLVLKKKFMNSYKKAIYYIRIIQEFFFYEQYKLNLLDPYFNIIKDEPKQQLVQISHEIKNTFKSSLENFQESFFKEYFNAIEYASQISMTSLNLQQQEKENLKMICQKFNIQTLQDLFKNFETQFDQFIKNIRNLTIKFIKSIPEKNQNNNMIQFKTYDMLDFLKQTCCIDWLQKFIDQNKETFLSIPKDEKIETISDVLQKLINFKRESMIAKNLKQILQAQQYRYLIFKEKFKLKETAQEQQNEQLDQYFKQNLINLMKQEKEKIEELIKESQQNFEIKIKEMLKMFKNDYMKIQNDNQKLNNEISQAALNLISEGQFIFLTIQNQNQKKDKLVELDNKYKQFFETNNQSNKEHSNKTLFQQTLSNEPNNIFLCWFDFCQKKINSNLENIQDLYFSLKSYKQMIQLGLFMILNLQEKNIDYNGEISNLKERSNQMIFNFNKKEENYESDQNFIDESDKEIQFNLDNVVGLSDIQSTNENCNTQIVDQIYLTILQDLEQYQIEIKTSILQIFDLKTPYKVKEFLVFNLIRLQQSVQEDCFTQFSSKFLQYLWIFEKDQRVRSLLKNKELIEMQKQLFSSNLQSSCDQIKQEMKQRINNLESLQQEIRLEGNLTLREQLQKKLEMEYEELDQYIDNLSEMSQKMEMSLLFLKDIQKDVKQIKNQIENIQNSLNQVGDDIRKLRGKKYDELLEIRKQKILQQSKLLEIDSIYVSVKTIEYDPISGNIKKTQEDQIISELLNDDKDNFKGEVNEFIWNQNENKDVMLLSGNAGSGKSRAARKIEEFIWNLHGKQSKWIPIYVSLPNLKNPKYNLFEQALETENYGFDKHQIVEFKEAIQNKQEYILMILDSYDEMKQDCIQQNLILTNKLIQDLNIVKQERQLKVIITTRKEILNIVGYQTWFYGESLESFKEVQLQNFDQDQIQEYLRKYVELSVRRKIKQIYEFVKQVQNNAFDLKEFQEIWGLIEKQVKIASEDNNTDEQIFRNQDLDSLLQKVTSHKTLKCLKEEHIITLRKDLEPLWSVNKFEKAIKNVGSTKYGKRVKRINRNQKFIYFKLFKNNQEIKIKNDNQKKKLEETEKEIQKLNEIVDQLDKKNFFSSYSITSVLITQNNSIFVDKTEFNFDFDMDEIDYVIQALKMKKLTIFDFYESFIKFYHYQQMQKQREKGYIPNYESFEQDIFQFSQSLALDMSIRDLSQVNYKQKGKLNLESKYNSFKNFDDWPNQYFSDTLDDQDYKKLIRSCILVSAKGSTYSFNHKSIQEFYVAKYILELLLFLDWGISLEFLKKIEEEKQILLKSLYNQIKFNISKENYIGIINFVKDKLQNMENTNNILINIVKLSTNEKYIYAASNSIYLLNQLNAYFESQDFSKIQLFDTSISGLSFFNSNLSKSKFDKVKIDSCNFNCANLTEVIWQDIICKEKPYLKGHESEVQIAIFSPKGNLIASGGKNKELNLWDVDNPEQMVKLIGHTDTINSVQFTSDNRLISSSNDGTIKLWDISNPQNPQLQVTIEDLKVEQIALSYNNNMLVSKSQDGFKIWNMPNLNLNNDNITIKGLKDDPKIFALSQDESKIAIGKKDLTILIINIKTKQEQKLIGHKGNISKLAFNYQGNNLASACTYCNLYIWDLCSFKLLQVLLFNQFQINHLAFIEKDKSIIVNSKTNLASIQLEKVEKSEEIIIDQCQIAYLSQFNDICLLGYFNYVAILDLNTLQIINIIDCEFTVESIQISSDSSKFSTEGNRKLIIWSLQTLQQLISLKDYNNYFTNDYCVLSKNFECGVYHNSEKAFIFNLQRILQARDLKSKQLVAHKYLSQNNCFTINFNNEILAYQIQYNQVILFDIINDQQLEILQLENFDSFEGFVFSPSVNILASVHGSKKINLWNLDNQPYLSQELVASFSQSSLMDFKYSYDGSLLIILDSNSSIYIWNSFNGDLVYTINEKKYNIWQEITISIDNQQIAFIDREQNKKIIVWNLQLMQEVILLKEDTQAVDIVKYFPNKMRLISYSNDVQVILFWNTIERTVEYKINCQISQVCFSKNGNLMASAQKEIIQLWDCSKVEIKKLGCQKVDSQIFRLNFIGKDNNLIYQQKSSILFLPQQLLNLEMIIEINSKYQDQQLISFSQNDQLLAIVQFCQIQIYFVQEWKLYKTLPQDSQIHSITFFSDGNQLISSNKHGVLTIWDVHSSEQMHTLMTYTYQSKLYLMNNDQILLQVGEQIKIWNLENKQDIKLCGLYSKQFKLFENYQEEQYFKQCVQIKFEVSLKKDYFCFNFDTFKFIIKQIKEQKDIKFYQHQCDIKKLEIFEQKQQCFIWDQNNDLIILTFQNENIFQSQIKITTTNDNLNIRNLNDLAISHDQKLLAVKNYDSIEIIKIVNQESKIICPLQKQYLQYHKNLFFNKNGDMLVEVISSEDFNKYNSYQSQIIIYKINKNFEQKIDLFRKFSDIIKFAKINNNFLSVLFDSGDILIINLIERQQKTYINFDNIGQIAISRDDKYIFFTSGKSLYQFDISELQFCENKQLEEIEKINCMTLINNNQICVADDDSIQLVNLNQQQKKQIIIGKTKKSNNLVYHPKFNLLISCGEDKMIYSWNIEAKRIIGIFEGHQGKINSLSFSSDGLTFASSSEDKLIKLWNIENNDQLDLKQGHIKSVKQLAISKDSLILASGGGFKDYNIILWDLIDMKYLISLEGHESNINCLDFSYCSKWLASGNEDGTIIFWDVKNPIYAKKLYVIQETSLSINWIQFSPNGKTLATKSKKKQSYESYHQIQFWNLNNIGKQNIQIDTNEKQLSCFTQNDQFIIQGFEKDIQFYELSSDQYYLLNGHQTNIILIDCSNDNTQIVSIDKYLNMFIWKFNNNDWDKQSISLFEPVDKKVVFSPENNIIASFNYNSITLTQLEELNQYEQLQQHDFDVQILNIGEITTFTQSYDGSRLFIQSREEYRQQEKSQLMIYEHEKKNYFFIKDWKFANQIILSNDGKYLAVCLQLRQKIEINIYIISDQQNFKQFSFYIPDSISLQFKQNDSNILYFTYIIDNQLIIKILNITQNSSKENLFQHDSANWKKSFISNNVNQIVAITKDSNLLFINRQNNKQNNSDISLLIDFQIECHAFSEDDKYFMVSTKNNSIYLWNIDDQKICDQLECFTGDKQIQYLAFSLENQIICYKHPYILLIKIQQDQKLKIVRQFKVFETIRLCSFCPQNLQISLINDDSTTLWVANLIERQQIILFESKMNDFCFSNDSKYIAAITDQYLIFWDANNYKELKRDPEWSGIVVQFFRDNYLIYSKDAYFYILDVSNLNEINQVQCIKVFVADFTVQISISKDLTYLASLGTQYIKLWNIKNIQQIKLEKIYPNKFYHEQKVLISQDCRFLIFNLNKNLQLIDIQEDCKQQQAIDFLEKIEDEFQYSSDGKPKLYNSETCQQLECTIDEESVQKLAFSLQRSVLALSCEQKVVCLQIGHENILKTKILQNFKNTLSAIAISPLGDKLISREQDSTISLWDIENEQRLSFISNQNDLPNVFAYIPNGNGFASGMEDGSVNLYRFILKNKNQSQQEDEKSVFSCCKSFSRNSLILAHNCILKDSKIEQSKKQILGLFRQKGGIN
ncbi:unnamed protein product [Paramecium sonneborni]|uniref:NACHT domain-containing protein n=1 Tax=Paramecium sonneborni TaxID=65129 RepID=A0A8S1R3L7_9CILI|nr:unnamed protein product [Paramecium sonneborni]